MVLLAQSVSKITFCVLYDPVHDSAVLGSHFLKDTITVNQIQLWVNKIAKGIETQT
jgi:hypothetical protein